jgi:hypothetical protein
VDDCVALGFQSELTNLAMSVVAKYSITGPGEVRWVLSMLLEHDHPERTISISQGAFIDSIITRFNLIDTSTVLAPLAPGSHLSAADRRLSHRKGRSTGDGHSPLSRARRSPRQKSGRSRPFKTCGYSEALHTRPRRAGEDPGSPFSTSFSTSTLLPCPPRQKVSLSLPSLFSP